MKTILQSLALLLVALMVPTAAIADYVQVADGVYRDGSALYITSGVTQLGPLQVNPSVIYSFAAVPPACDANTFTGYDATLHVPTVGMVSYFSAQYWYNFNDITADAVEPQSVILSQMVTELEVDEVESLTATVAPSNATPAPIYWSSTNTTVATVSNGRVMAVAAGECDIIATCVDKQAVCHVTVIPKRVTITLDKHEAHLLLNHTMTLTATCVPMTTNLSVTSSDSTVAIPRYVNGTIMLVGVGEGTATITVTTTDGWANPDACVVTVFTELGDANCDGFVDISDVSLLIDYLLGNDVGTFKPVNADTDKDGEVGISDVAMLIDALLGNVDLNPPVTETFTVNGVSFTMVTVEGGTFRMGATAEQGSDIPNENPVHQVTLSSYCIGQTEVTQALWQAVMGSNPSWFTSSNGYEDYLQRPVECVSWNDCQTFITRLNELTGKSFRLPTEAEWEFAARGGNRSKGYKYAGSNDINEVAWYWDNSSDGSNPVALKAPNELGLYDMSGNVFEWCQDLYGSYSSEVQINPTGPVSGSLRVLRGGCWYFNASICHVSFRSNDHPTDTLDTLGLRLAL